ncbi:MAG: SRPBCC domain-containing protein [Deltaproteobacteria bacterium]|nr:SRPBCC domain-containing protein [Deltaproteobacteria bacterium]
MRILNRFLLLSFTLVNCACQTVQAIKPPEEVRVDGKAERERSKNALEYRVALIISAPAEQVWAVLTDGPRFTEWNTTLETFSGTIARDEDISLVFKAVPDRLFELHVSYFQPQQRMVWEDSMPMGMFAGVRTFTLLPHDDGTLFVMSEVYSGSMLPMIEKDLPDMRTSFEIFAQNLKERVESR